jgi:hypothetical protein
VDVTITLSSENLAKQVAQVLGSAGGSATVTGKSVKATGDWGQILAAALADSDLMYNNNGAAMQAKYQGLGEKYALHAWWQFLKGAEKVLNEQKKFAEAKIGNNVLQKAVECAYNFYGIEGQSIMASLGLVVFSLLFYVIYTLWYGFGIMYLFEGAGFRLEH